MAAFAGDRIVLISGNVLISGRLLRSSNIYTVFWRIIGSAPVVL
jgi:hypothetical protein